nr:MAG TPA: hypothetical protein [Caudoviricetes sp.]
MRRSEENQNSESPQYSMIFLIIKTDYLPALR